MKYFDKMDSNKRFSAEEFVENILTKGNEVPCDETSEYFRKTELPPYYDEKLYKRGQEFFSDNIFSVSINNFFGLVVLLAIPDTLKLLIMTKMSGCDLTAYRRYTATILHTLVWYESDFKPGSRLLASIADIKRQHNSASKRSISKLKYRITQKGMATTQFGFMGFVLARTEMLGIHNAKEEDLKAFIHVWRVLGHLLGIEERFNICRESVDETRQICNILIDQYFRPRLMTLDKEFVEMTNYLINGLRLTDPLFMDFEMCMTTLQMLLENQIDYRHIAHPKYKELSSATKMKIILARSLAISLKYSAIRWLVNYISRCRIWLIEMFPFTAYLKFGVKNAKVEILPRHKSID